MLRRLLTVVDDPTIAGAGFFGGFPVHDDGVRAAPTTLVERGILRTLLSTRNPVARVDASSGNLLAQAKLLATKEQSRPKQASLRRSVSAAYYALFHLLVDASAR